MSVIPTPKRTQEKDHDFKNKAPLGIGKQDVISQQRTVVSR